MEHLWMQQLILFHYPCFIGFNCGEATNIATPCWLQVAKEAAIRRASTNSGPMVSHYQLLYQLALSLHLRFACSKYDLNCCCYRTFQLSMNIGEDAIQIIWPQISFLEYTWDAYPCIKEINKWQPTHHSLSLSLSLSQDVFIVILSIYELERSVTSQPLKNGYQIAVLFV